MERVPHLPNFTQGLNGMTKFSLTKLHIRSDWNESPQALNAMTNFSLTKLHIRFEWNDKRHKNSPSARPENAPHSVKHGDRFVTAIQQVETADDIIRDVPIIPTVHLQHSRKENRSQGEGYITKTYRTLS